MNGGGSLGGTLSPGVIEEYRLGMRLRGPSPFIPLERGKHVVSMCPTVRLFLASVSVALVVLGFLAVPSALADQCRVTAILLDGTAETFTVNAPPGTPPLDMLPPGTPPVQSVTSSCQATTTPAGLRAPSSATTPVTTTSQSTTTHPSSPTRTITTTTTENGGADLLL